jgi:hypothetical protein
MYGENLKLKLGKITVVHILIFIFFNILINRMDSILDY